MANNCAMWCKIACYNINVEQFRSTQQVKFVMSSKIAPHEKFRSTNNVCDKFHVCGPNLCQDSPSAQHTRTRCTVHECLEPEFHVITNDSQPQTLAPQYPSIVCPVLNFFETIQCTILSLGWARLRCLVTDSPIQLKMCILSSK